MNDMILIYDDGMHGTAHIHMALAQLTDVPAHFCTATMIMDGCLSDNHTARLLIMPGGADLFFCEKLNGDGNARIKDFVAKGGSYLGICAGAYYGCAALDWACGEIAGDRELAFYQGRATGPVYDWIENKDNIYEGSWIKAVEIETTDGYRFMTQYNGGPVFDVPPHHGEREENGDIHTLATYSELNKPAVIGGTFGQGKYVLSSPHIEIFGHLHTDRLYKFLNNSYNREAKAIDILRQHDAAQKEFFKTIVEELF